VASEAERRGEDALRTGDWKSARSELGRALASAETPAALDGMARALWWLADVEAAVAYRARAFTAYRRAEDLDTAARIAWWIVREYATVLANPAGANGWLTRGQRLLDSAPPGPGHGWLELARAQRSTDRATQLRYAESAYTLARQFDDPDLEIYSLAQQGLARIATGPGARTRCRAWRSFGSGRAGSRRPRRFSPGTGICRRRSSRSPH
jgi:hypothetical protein